MNKLHRSCPPPWSCILNVSQIGVCYFLFLSYFRFSSPQTNKIKDISEPLQLESYIVVADYAKQARNEINLKANELVEVFEKLESGWW